MNKITTLILLAGLFITLRIQAQLQPIYVAENTLKVPAFGEEVFYYGY